MSNPERRKKSRRRHTHKYKFVKLEPSGYEVYRCMAPDCTHYVQVDLAIGRSTICWRCGNVTTITAEKLVKPHCATCTKTYNWTNRRIKRPVKVDAIMKNLDALLKGTGDD